MNDFNINPQYKEYRRKKKRKAAILHNLKVFAVFASIILIIGSIFAVLFVSGAFSKDPPPETPVQSILPPTEATPSPLPTDDGRLTVFIDAGRGCLALNGEADRGIGVGSAYYEISNGKYESDLNLELALKLKNSLIKEGYKVIMLRETELNYGISLEHRVTIANKSEVDLFISIHASSGKPNDRGAKILYSQKNPAADKSLALATSIAGEIDVTLGELSAENTLVENSNLEVCEKAEMPSIQINTLFLTNSQDSYMAISEDWQNGFIGAVIKGIKDQFPIK